MNDLLSDKGYGLILTALMAKYQPYLEVAGPTSIDKFFYTGERGKSETFANYVAAKEVARQEMESHLQERLCERIAGRVLLRHANLTEWQRELMALREQNQLLTFDQIAALLRPLDRPELLAQAAGAELGAQAAKHYPVMQNEDDQEDEEQDDFEDNMEESDATSDNELAEGELMFEDREYEEDEALYIQAYHSAYADVRKDLNARRKERGFVRRRPASKEGARSGKGKGYSKDKRTFRSPAKPFRSSGPRSSGKNVMRGNADDLQSRTRCFNCQQLGHFARDCPLKGSGKGAPKPAPKQAAFVICRGNGQPATHYMTAMQLGRLDKVISVFAGVQVSAADALVDTAAEDAVIGERAMVRLEAELKKCGLTTVSVPSAEATPCAGIGGQAKIQRVVDAPVGVAGIHGLLRFTVLADTDKFQTPPLLPISFLEAIGAIIDLSQERLRTPDGHEACLVRLPSGHRSVNILDFGDAQWQLPHACLNGVDPFRHSLVLASVEPQFRGRDAADAAGAPSTSTAAAGASSTTSPGSAPEVQVEEFGDEEAETATMWASITNEENLDTHAKRLLQERDFSAKAMEELLGRMTFHGKSGREVLISRRKDAGAAAFGLYIHGSMSGVTTITARVPNFVQYVNCWFQNYMKGHPQVKWPCSWTSFSVNINMSSKPHQDHHNAVGSDNVVATFGTFQGGGLWREADPGSISDVKWKMRRGKRVPGEVLNPFHKPTTFDPKRLHATMAWSGRRVSITLYTVRSHDNLLGRDVGELQQLGFPGLTAMHYLESESLSRKSPGVEQWTECEHDFEAVFEERDAITPTPSMLKHMLSKAASWLSRHRAPTSTVPNHVQSCGASEPHGGGRSSGGTWSQEAFFECEEVGGRLEADDSAASVDAGHGQAPNGAGLPDHPQRTQGEYGGSLQGDLLETTEEPTKANCPGHWRTSSTFCEPQDMAMRAQGMPSRPRSPSLSGEPKGLVVDTLSIGY